jgi:flagellar hook-associated protein 1 FlgK
MSNLISALQTASSAMEAFSAALNVDQTNVANASTPGYAALNARILPIDLSGDGASAGGDYLRVTSTGNALADAAVRAAFSHASASEAESQQLTPVNQLFDITGQTGILAAFQQFSTAFANLSVTPNDPTLGANALSAAGSVAAAFQSAATGLESQQAQTESAVQTTISQINDLATQIAQLNVQAAAPASSQPNPGVDANLRSALDQLSSLVDITVQANPATGAISVLAGGELPLVLGDQAYSLSADPNAAAGSQISSSGGGLSPAAFSGQLGGLLQTLNNTINPLLAPTGSAGSLNTLASGFATRVNTLLSAGLTTSGAAGVPIFLIGNAADAASTLTLDNSVTASELGVGTAANSNGTANTLAALPSSTAAANQVGGLSAEQYFGSLAATVGQSLSDANTQSTADQTTLTSAQANRTQISGVSLDQEAVDITAYQRSYDAAAQVVQILNQLTSEEVNILNGNTQ